MNREQLTASAQALLDLDARGALHPHGIGGHARSIIEGFLALAALPPPRGELVERLRKEADKKSWMGSMPSIVIAPLLIEAADALTELQSPRATIDGLRGERDEAQREASASARVCSHLDVLDTCLESYWCMTEDGTDNRLLAEQAIDSVKRIRAIANGVTPMGVSPPPDDPEAAEEKSINYWRRDHD